MASFLNILKRIQQ